MRCLRYRSAAQTPRALRSARCAFAFVFWNGGAALGGGGENWMAYVSRSAPGKCPLGIAEAARPS
eukprot:1376409-Pyramimonas_sp.AAC.1